MPKAYEESPIRYGLGEVVAALTLLYICTIAAFNAGYFLNVPGHFDKLFTFPDLVEVNIPILQYLVSLSAIYFVIWFISTIFLRSFQARLKARAESIAIEHHHDQKLFWAACLFLVGLSVLATSILDHYHVSNFTLRMLPDFTYNAILVYFFLIGFKYKLTSINPLVVASLLSVFYLSFNSGSAWLKSEVSSATGMQSIVAGNGQCVERKILRSSSNGLLLYDPTTKQFEFRNRDFFRTIFAHAGNCT